MKEMKSSLEKGLNDDLPENVSFFNTCGVLHKYCLSPFIALLVTKTVLIKFKIKILGHDSSINQLLPSFLALNGQLAGLLVQPSSFPEQRKMKN